MTRDHMLHAFAQISTAPGLHAGKARWVKPDTNEEIKRVVEAAARENAKKRARHE